MRCEPRSPDSDALAFRVNWFAIFDRHLSLQECGPELARLTWQSTWLQKLFGRRTRARGFGRRSSQVAEETHSEFCSSLVCGTSSLMPRWPSFFRYWFRVVDRRVIDRIRQDRRRRQREYCYSRASWQLDDSLLAETHTFVEHLLASLPKDERLLLNLKYCEGQSSAAIGELLGLSSQAVRQRVYRSLTRLRANYPDGPP